MKDLFSLSQKNLQDLGVVDWGYTDSSMAYSYPHYEKWINQGLHAPLNYLADYRKDLRNDLKKVYPEFQSALVFLFSYKNSKKWLLENNFHQAAAYTLGFEGEDYHYALSKKLEIIFESLKSTYPSLDRFIALDVSPILERDLAYRAGLGWFGKNSMLINKKEGSYFIIASLCLNQKLPLEKKQIDTDHCGQCLACVKACPTQAIDAESRTLISSQCISTFTIETFKDSDPPEGFEKSRDEIFGCDICQDVCPWNRRPLAKAIGVLKIQDRFLFLKHWLFELPKSELLKLFERQSNRSIKRQLRGTAFDRPGREGWMKNLKASLSRPK